MSKSQKQLLPPYMCLAANPADSLSSKQAQQPSYTLKQETLKAADKQIKKKQGLKSAHDPKERHHESNNSDDSSSPILPLTRAQPLIQKYQINPIGGQARSQKLKRSHSYEYSTGGKSIYLTQPNKLLHQAQKLYREQQYKLCIMRLLECQRCPQWQELTHELEMEQPLLYKFVLNCLILTAYTENKLQRYSKAADTCDKILNISENCEALIVKAGSLAAIAKYPEAIIRYKRALAVSPGNKHCIEQIKYLRKQACNRIIEIPQLEMPQHLATQQQNSVDQSNPSGMSLSGFDSTLGSTFRPSESTSTISNRCSHNNNCMKCKVIHWVRGRRIAYLLVSIFVMYLMLRKGRLMHLVKLALSKI